MKSGLYISAAALTREIEEDSWLLALPAVAGLRERPLVFHRPVTFFVGENGTGKSTLLEAIAAAWGFNPEGGHPELHLLHQALPLRPLEEPDADEAGICPGRLLSPGGELLQRGYQY